MGREAQVVQSWGSEELGRALSGVEHLGCACGELARKMERSERALYSCSTSGSRTPTIRGLREELSQVRPKGAFSEEAEKTIQRFNFEPQN